MARRPIRPSRQVMLFVEGKTELNYFRELKRNNHLQISYKEVDMGGGGYSSMLKQLKMCQETGFLAIVVVIDLDRYHEITGEREKLDQLVAYCKKRSKVSKGNVPYLITGSNKSFEYFLCCHCDDYRHSDTKRFLKDSVGYRDLEDMKSDRQVYQRFNKDGRTYKVALSNLNSRSAYLTNIYKLNVNGLDIKIILEDIQTNREAVGLCSNMFDLFRVLGLQK